MVRMTSLVKVIFDYFVMLGKLLMLCGQQVEPMLVVCMMRQGPGGWVCLARNLSSQQQKHTGDKNWPNPSGCQSLTGQAGVFTSHETVRIRGPCTVNPPNILELPRMDTVDSQTTRETSDETVYYKVIDKDDERSWCSLDKSPVFSVLENNKRRRDVSRYTDHYPDHYRPTTTIQSSASM